MLHVILEIHQNTTKGQFLPYREDFVVHIIVPHSVERQAYAYSGSLSSFGLGTILGMWISTEELR